LKCWLPITTGGPIRSEKIRGGEVFSQADLDTIGSLERQFNHLEEVENTLNELSTADGTVDLLRGYELRLQAQDQLRLTGTATPHSRHFSGDFYRLWGRIFLS